MIPPSFQAVALAGIPLVQPGDNLVGLILQAVQRANLELANDDVLVISSKIVSKAEGRFARVDSVIPTPEAMQYADASGKDPRIVQLVLNESRLVSRVSRGVLVTEHRLGFVSANAGIDQSNVENSDEQVLLLPRDPDGTAALLRQAFQTRTGANIAIVISDTHGRPFRFGNVGVAIGVAGMQALTDLRGQKDLFGRELQITQQGYADLVSSAAHLLCGEAAEGLPVVLIRGLALPHGDGKASDLNRPAEKDLYR